MKINRRDYLKQLGAAGVFAGAAGLKGFAHENADPQRPCPVESPCIDPSPAPAVWEPRCCEFPPNPRSEYVKLIFEGLMGVARYKDGNKTRCDIGFHNKGDSPLHHHLSIRAYNNAVNDDNCTAVYKTPAATKIKKLELKVSQPKVVDQAVFYQPGQACSRQQLTSYEDFRWIVDFESNYHYGKDLKKNKNIYRPTMRVPCGIFYTLRKTASTFRTQTTNGSRVCQLGNVADLIAANIYIESRSYVELIVDGVSYQISAPGEIYFTNHCRDDDQPNEICNFNPYNLKEKKKRSDFFLNYKAFDRDGADEYELFLAESHDQSKWPDVICEKSAYKPSEAKKFNDESPCSAAGYGKGDGGLPANSP